MIVKIKNSILSRFSRARNDRNGFTLIELIIAMTILSIVLLGLGYMWTSGSNMYVQLNRYSATSLQSQIAIKQLNEYMIDCNGICKYTDADGNKCIALYEHNRKRSSSGGFVVSGTKTLYIDTVNAFCFNRSDNSIYLIEYTVDEDKTLEPSEKIPFASKVSDFDVTFNYENDEKVSSLNISLANVNSGNTKNRVVSLRNTPLTLTELETNESLNVPQTLYDKCSGQEVSA